MAPPPADPVAITKSPGWPLAAVRNTSVGDIELRGRLLAAMLLAIGAPAASIGDAEKSVSWLLRIIPLLMWNEPMLDSTVVVAETTLPLPSTIEKWLVPYSGVVSIPRSTSVLNAPAVAVPMLAVSLISAARLFRYALLSSVSGLPPGSGTKSVSAMYLSRSE